MSAAQRGSHARPSGLAAALASFPAGVDLLVVDNGSTDATAATAAAHGARVVTEPRRGSGAACLAGVLASPHAEVVAFADADGSFDGADLPAVAGPVLAGAADLVLGSRVTGERAPGALRPLALAENRAIALAENRAIALACRLLLGLPLTDLGPFRAIRRADLLALGLADRGSGWPLEMVGRAAMAGLRVAEVPVRYRPRAGGRSKVSGSLRGTACAVAAMARVAWRLAEPAPVRAPARPAP